MNIWLYSLSSVAVVSLISLVGVLTIALGTRRLDRVIPLLISLAVGGLFGDALVHLLPGAYEDSTSTALTSLYVLLGILIFFVLERFLHWHHEHHAQALNPVRPVGYINLVADGAHNLVDGLAIGASYLVSAPVGLATTLAIMLHEIPQELGDFGILVHAGYSRRRALFLNFLSALLALAGVVASLLIGPAVGGYEKIIMPLTAGGFIYIAGSDLIPELHHEHKLPDSVPQLAFILIGIGFMYLILLVE
ncbi:MAG: ZIP family metal transporter [Dehalococcoidia bacterium]|nr:ZIP family metal transporter [Dehalococcoidia bacterium]